MMNNVLILELFVGILVSFSLLGILIWAIKSGQFEDNKKAMDGLLFDSTEDLQNAVRLEEKQKKMKEAKEASKEEQSKEI